jgi:hypothetical protein
VKTRRQLGCWRARVRGGKWCGGGLGMAVLLSSCLLRGRNGAAFHDPSPPSRAAKSRELAPRTLLLPLLRHATPSQIHHLSLASLLSTAATAPIGTLRHSLLQRSQPAAPLAIAPAAHSRRYVAILFPLRLDHGHHHSSGLSHTQPAQPRTALSPWQTSVASARSTVISAVISRRRS